MLGGAECRLLNGEPGRHGEVLVNADGAPHCLGERTVRRELNGLRRLKDRYPLVALLEMNSFRPTAGLLDGGISDELGGLAGQAEDGADSADVIEGPAHIVAVVGRSGFGGDRGGIARGGVHHGDSDAMVAG